MDLEELCKVKQARETNTAGSRLSLESKKGKFVEAESRIVTRGWRVEKRGDVGQKCKGSVMQDEKVLGI